MRILFALLFVWQLPQNVVALAYILFCFRQMRPHVPLWVANKWGVPVLAITTASRSGSVSLGAFVFVSRHSGNVPSVLRHELGHTAQSIMLGPLYLFVVGLPSLAWAALRSAGLFRRWHYSDFFTESWANRLS